VDDNGEWAGYWLASWSGIGPERYGSFYDLMYHLYASFHSLCRPEGQTRERWDARVEQAGTVASSRKGVTKTRQGGSSTSSEGAKKVSNRSIVPTICRV
jgi:hypothetical protein